MRVRDGLVGPAERAARLMITLRDVAKESGFSPTTVSIVLNNAPLARYIPAPTRHRIEAAAKRLGYHPNLFARSLRNKRSQAVGVMVFDMTDPYCTLILRGIENTLYQSSFLPILTDVHNELSRFERYLKMLLGRGVEALIVLANWLFLDINLLSDLERRNVPTVMIGHELRTETMSSAVVDNEAGARAALEHLYALGIAKSPSFEVPRRCPIPVRDGRRSVASRTAQGWNSMPSSLRTCRRSLTQPRASRAAIG